MPLLFPAATQVIPRDAEQERAKCPAFRIKPFGVANQRHENLLGYVLGDRRVPAHVQSEAVYRRMPSPVQKREGTLIPGHHPPEQQPVIYGFDNPVHLRLLDGPAQLSLHIPGAGRKSSRKMRHLTLLALASRPLFCL